MWGDEVGHREAATFFCLLVLTFFCSLFLALISSPQSVRAGPVHGSTLARSAQASHRAMRLLAMSGSELIRLWRSVRSASISYSSQGPLYFMTSFHLPSRTARLPSWAKKMGFLRSS